MLNKKSSFIILTSLLIAGLVGCGGGAGNSDVTTSSSGAQLQSISITPANPTLAVNTSQQFTATGIYSDNTTQDLTSSVTWTSSSLDVASGSDEAGFTGLYASDSGSFYRAGHITATHGGRAKITGKWRDISGSTDVTVTSATLVSIAITPADSSIAIGTTQQFIAMGTFSDNSTQDLTTAVTWNSSTAVFATISNAAGSNGLATSVAAGSTTITATSVSIAGTATLTVTGTGGGVVTLTWDAPTTNTDGSSLNPATDLSMYKVYYGTASQTYTQVVNVANPGTTTITTTLNLSPGTYYVVVTTVDTSGQESSYSNEAMKTI